MDYLELNKVTPLLHAAVPNTADLMDGLTLILGQSHCVVDLDSAFFTAIVLDT